MADWGQLMSSEERERLARFRSSHSKDNKRGYDDTDLKLAEFGMLYGWNAVHDYMCNRMTPDFFERMLKAGRKIKEVRRVELMVDVRQAVNAAIAGKKASGRFDADLRKRLRHN